VNPNDVANTISIDVEVYDRSTGVSVNVPWRTLTLPANGTLLELEGPHLASLGTLSPALFESAFGLLSPPIGIDIDLTVHVTSEDGLPILGDGMMTDFLGDDGGDNLVLGERYRMASTMMATDPNWILVNPDFSFDELPDRVIQTLMGVSNVGNSDAGPVRVQYFNSSGSLINTATQASLPPGATLRIEPGVLGYPRGQTDIGWVRIFGCTQAAQLVGWSVREVQSLDNLGLSQFQKVYGETLLGITGAEPGKGIDLGANTRKVKPIGRTTPFFAWPGYTTFVNNTTNNIGQYSFELFSPTSTSSCGSSGTFVGLPFGETSTTYEDGFSFCSGNISLSVDHAKGEVEGIGVLGDPYVEYAIPGFAGN
ncbi:MAG: hypothetical protein AAFX85_13340, partial [Pseudomonadota bacterium]